MAAVAAIDDLFRQKPLDDIRVVLRQTRDEVEAKKRELRELVGDHYRSVLESSDHIRAMSDCAVRVSEGADRVEELLASMRSLAENPPAPQVVAKPAASGASSPAAPEEDREYTVSVHIMSLLDIPDIVRGHLHDLAFVRGARSALVDAITLQGEVDELLHKGAAAEGAFDFAGLLRQQSCCARGLPRQIAASCVDGFAAPGLLPTNAAESFVVHLLMDSTAQPVALMRRFLRHRVDTVDGLLGGYSKDGAGVGAKLISAAIAVDGTVVLGSALCPTPDGAGLSPCMEAALAALLEGAPASTAAEERAAIEGRVLEQGIGAFRRRVDALGSKLRQSGALLRAELAKVGQDVARAWAAEAGAKRLDERFARLIATAPAGEMQTCLALSKVAAACAEKISTHRRELLEGCCASPADWGSQWAHASQTFCPGCPPLRDTLRIVTDVIEAACADVIRERVRNLQLVLLQPGEEDAEGIDNAESTSFGTAGGHSSDAQRREEIMEIQRQCRVRIASFDEQLGEVLSDMRHVAAGGGQGELPSAVTQALLTALEERIVATCNTVRLPEVSPLWPVGAAAGAARKPHTGWSLQRRAARAAIALDTLLAVATSEAGGGGGDGTAASEKPQQQLQAALAAAASSGSPELSGRSLAIVESLRQRSKQAYAVWARLAITPADSVSGLTAFWRLADDEVGASCGWGTAKFAQRGASEAAKAVPVPTQASPFVFEQLALGARRALEISGSLGAMPAPLVAAVKGALSEGFMAAYKEQPPDMESLKKSGMSHFLQWLFDLKFLRIALASGAETGLSTAGDSAYEALCGAAAGPAGAGLLNTVETTALSDPVDRLLFQEVIETSVKSHLQSVRILLAPLFLHNPAYTILAQRQAGAMGAGATGVLSAEAAVAASALAKPEAAGGEDSFELQPDYAPPLRQQLPRFPLLPVAMASSLASPADLDPRMGLGGEADRSTGRAGGVGQGPGAPGATGAGGVSSLMQQALGLGSRLPFGNTWAGLGGGGGGGKMPEAV